MANLRPVADSVKRATGFASVAIELVRDDAPAAVRGEAVKRAREIIGLQQAATGKDVIVVPILVSSGDVSQRKLPADLAGMPIVYTGEPLLLDTKLARWVEHRVLDANLRCRGRRRCGATVREPQRFAVSDERAAGAFARAVFYISNVLRLAPACPRRGRSSSRAH